MGKVKILSVPRDPGQATEVLGPKLALADTQLPTKIDVELVEDEIKTIHLHKNQ